MVMESIAGMCCRFRAKLVVLSAPSRARPQLDSLTVARPHNLHGRHPVVEKARLSRQCTIECSTELLEHGQVLEVTAGVADLRHCHPSGRRGEHLL